MKKRKIVSGITATGRITLGNYIGVIKNLVKLQDDYELYVFVADLHAITLPIESKILKENKKDIMALYVAAGLDPKKVVLFNQSSIMEHAQMGYLLMTQTTMGELNKMTQFKDKSQSIKSSNGTQFIPTGLYIYPTLMAGDILLYNPDYVLVGADQKQHLELTRNIAQRINNKFNTKFNIPNYRESKYGKKIMSLVDPTKKMSKSSSDSKSYISLLDEPNLAKKKIMSAVTDSENKVYLSDSKLGIKNLLIIYSELEDMELEKVEQKFKNHNYKDFKICVANSVEKFLINLQEKYKRNINNIKEIQEIGNKKAQEVARKNLNHLQEKMGLN